MKESAFLRKFMGSNEEAALDEESVAIGKLHPPESFEEKINRYYLWQIAGANVM